MNKKLLILGDGELSKTVFEIASSTNFFVKIEILDDNKLQDAEKLFGEYRYAIPVFIDSALRKKWVCQMKEWSYMIPTLIHKTAVVDPDATYYEGVIICASAKISKNSVICDGCVIDSDTLVGENVYVDRFSTIQKDAVIESGAILPAHSVVGCGKTVKKEDNPSAGDFLKRAFGE